MLLDLLNTFFQPVKMGVVCGPGVGRLFDLRSVLKFDTGQEQNQMDRVF